MLVFSIIHVWNHFCLVGALLWNIFVAVVVLSPWHHHFEIIQNFLFIELWNKIMILVAKMWICDFRKSILNFTIIPNSLSHGFSSIDSLAPFDSLAPSISSGRLPTVRRGLWRGEEWFEGLRVEGDPSRYSRVCSDPWPESNVPAGEALNKRSFGSKIGSNLVKKKSNLGSSRVN